MGFYSNVSGGKNTRHRRVRYVALFCVIMAVVGAMVLTTYMASARVRDPMTLKYDGKNYSGKAIIRTRCCTKDYISL